MVTVRPAAARDAAAITRIYNEGIEERTATLETEPRPTDEFERRLAAGEVFLVAERAGEVVGWGAIFDYSDRCAYAGVGEYTLYVARSARRAGAGARLLDALIEEARRRGRHKLIGKIFTSNEPSVALAHRAGFRDVGVHEAHGRLDGDWKDVLVVERLLGGR
ncbi:MAG: arsinothricin resistance N-acetyltransferase ArsN1 family A [Chloroflexota bacterium]